VIPHLPGWTVARDRHSLVQAPPGTSTEGVRYIERMRPSQAPLDVVRSLPMPDDATLLSVADPIPLVTDEGEYAHLVRVEASQGGRPIHRAIGIVHVDDFDAITIGVTHRPESAQAMDALVESLVREDRHYLAVRRRPYRCALPHVDPARVITTFPAIPLDAEAPTAVAERLIGFRFAHAASEPVLALGGLQGRQWTASGVVSADVAVLVDQRFLYVATHIGTTSDDGTFAAVVASIEPIPRNRYLERTTTALDLWTD
jgi:hypothetical protein